MKSGTRIRSYVFFFTLLLFTINCTENGIQKEVSKTPRPFLREESIPSGNFLTQHALQSYLIDSLSPIKSKKYALNPFDTINFDAVVAYDFAGSEETYPGIFDSAGNFVPVVFKQKELSEIQAAKIVNTLASPKTYGGFTAACFHPHLALVFYKAAVPQLTVNVCLSCNYLTSSKHIPAMHSKKRESASGSYDAIGFSLFGRKIFIQLCRQLHFQYADLAE